MTNNLIEFKKAPSYALATTGLASVAALMSGTVAAQAQDSYIGFSYGGFQGEAPNENASSSPEDYELDGGALGFFVGRDLTTVGAMTIGAELAYTGAVEGDPNEEADYDNAYDIDFMFDAKLRAGTDIGSVMVYGFAGVTLGKASNYYEPGYDFSGVNYGIGAQMDVATNMFIGAEVTGRTIDGYDDDSGDRRTDHAEVSLRAGFKF
jgi:opacity protein-like surface antigen